MINSQCSDLEMPPVAQITSRYKYIPCTYSMDHDTLTMCWKLQQCPQFSSSVIHPQQTNYDHTSNKCRNVLHLLFWFSHQSAP